MTDSTKGKLAQDFKKGYEDSIDCISLADKYTELYEKYFGDP